jgi:hypothetical protein
MEIGTGMGRLIVAVGLGVIVLGGVVWLAERLGLRLGQLPGDFRFQFGSVTCAVPLMTSILLSLLLTVALNLAARLWK